MFGPGLNLSDAPLRVRVALTVLSGGGGEMAAIAGLVRAIKPEGDEWKDKPPQELTAEGKALQKSAADVVTSYLKGVDNFLGDDPLLELGEEIKGPAWIFPDGSFIPVPADAMQQILPLIGQGARAFPDDGKVLFVRPNRGALV